MKLKKCCRKIASFVVASAIFLTAAFGWQLDVQASTGAFPLVKVQNASAAPGEEVEVVIGITNNPGILGAAFEISYAPELELISSESGDAFSALNLTRPGQYLSPCNFVWDGQELLPDDIRDGPILILTFQVSENADIGGSLGIRVTCESGNVVDNDLRPISIGTEDGTVIIHQKAEAERPIISTATGMSAGDKVSVSIDSLTAYAGATLVLASYDDQARMLDSIVEGIDLKPGENILEFQKQDENTIYKAFLMDNHFRPCCPAIVFSSESNPDDTAPAIVVSSVAAKPGDTDVEVKVRIQNNPGVLGMILSISYDDETLTLKDAVNGEAVRDVLSMTKSGKFASPCRFLWDGQEITAEDIKDGEILSLKFDVSADAGDGSYPITVTYTSGDIIDNDFQSVNLAVKSGALHVAK